MEQKLINILVNAKDSYIDVSKIIQKIKSFFTLIFADLLFNSVIAVLS